MFRHTGKNRTFGHNLKLASILSFVAGIVNISGLLTTSVLTTNVTGHFASFAEDFVRQDFANAFIFILYILCFLSGSFISSMCIHLTEKFKPEHRHVLPIVLEIVCLLIVILTGDHGIRTACFLLSAMGLQNALVTSVSNAVVRTTHLTGLFTDLGIELSRLFFPIYERKWLIRSIELRFSIILCFFTGCVLGGFLYQMMSIHVLYLAICLLIFAMGYDITRIRLHLIRRQIRYFKK